MRMPTEEHFAIITTTSHTVPGDERSRTNPGHGYPEHTVESINYESFATEELLLARLNRMSERERTNARVIRAIPLTVSTKVSVELG